MLPISTQMRIINIQETLTCIVRMLLIRPIWRNRVLLFSQRNRHLLTSLFIRGHKASNLNLRFWRPLCYQLHHTPITDSEEPDPCIFYVPRTFGTAFWEGMLPVRGFEPPTTWLKVKCSTSWATRAYFNFPLYWGGGGWSTCPSLIMSKPFSYLIYNITHHF